MKSSIGEIVLVFVTVLLTTIPCMAEDVKPPFAWQGDGVASIIGKDGTNDINFKFEFAIDEDGLVNGKTSNKDGESAIKHIFCSEKKESDWPGFFTRRIVIVLMLNESGDNPMLSVINGRVLADKFIYGELLVSRYEHGSDIASVLGVGDSEMTQIETGELPYDLSSTLEKCQPIGIARIEGDYVKEPETISLFNGENLDGWYGYLKDGDVDVKSVWSVKDGAIFCSGKPAGYLRTREKYGDFKLSVQWRWPDKPTNSGVLLCISSEDKVWPLCMEAQLQNEHAGDFVGMGCEFNEYTSEKKSFFRVVAGRNGSSEKKAGQWNTYEIVCKTGTIELTVNGELKNKATGVSVGNGYIGLQSEGGPIMFRNIQLTPLR